MVDRAHGRRRGHAAGWFQPLGVRRSANFFCLENTMRFLWSRRRHTKVPGRSRSPRLQVQVLEDRTVPAFLAPLGVDAGFLPYSVAVGDFDGDSKPDLAVTDSGNNQVSVLLGNGDGTFQAFRNFSVGTFPRSVAVGDLDRDGTLDLAVADSGSNEVSVLLGNGDGTFQTVRNYAAGSLPFSVTVGD